MIRDTIILDVDPELFLEKTLEDISFVDNTLKILLGQLEENQLFIGKEELLAHLSKAEWQFSQVIFELLNHNGGFSVRENPSIGKKLIDFQNNSLERRKLAENLGLPSDSISASPIVSSDELTELLKAF